MDEYGMDEFEMDECEDDESTLLGCLVIVGFWAAMVGLSALILRGLPWA